MIKICNKKYLISTIYFFIVLGIGIMGYSCYKRNPKNIFYESINSIVEVKATDGKQSSFGTAVFIGDKKHLITNAHVVVYKEQHKKKAYESVKIRFADESQYRNVSVKYFDEKKDIAILDFVGEHHKVEGFRVADPNKIDFGNKVYAIGNSMNYGISIAQGIISIPKVEIDYNEESKKMIQADVTISAGNSGGALLDQNGKLIGITTFRTKDANGNIVYGNAFAIPINDVLSYVDKVE